MSFPRLCCSWHNSLGDLDLLLRSKSASRLLCTFQNLFFPSLYPSFVTVGVKMGTLLGAVTGALIGQETESGFIRGAAVGAISGAVFSIEVFESSLVLWKSNESRFGCLLCLMMQWRYPSFWCKFSASKDEQRQQL